MPSSSDGNESETSSDNRYALEKQEKIKKKSENSKNKDSENGSNDENSEKRKDKPRKKGSKHGGYNRVRRRCKVQGCNQIFTRPSRHYK